MTVGQRIKEKREKLNLSQSELAKIMNVSRQAISKAELHDSNITTDKVRKFAKALGVTEAYLMGWEKLEEFGEEVRKNGHTFEITTIPEEELESKEEIVKRTLRDACVHNAEEQEKKDKIFAYLDQLNEDGFNEVIKRLEELSELSKYKKES